MTFNIHYHIYNKDIKINKTQSITFKWYEYISTNRVLKRFFENLHEEYPVYLNDIDSINLVF